MARDQSDRSLVGRGGFTRFDLDGETVLQLSWAVRNHASLAVMERLGSDGLASSDVRVSSRAGPACTRTPPSPLYQL